MTGHLSCILAPLCSLNVSLASSLSRFLALSFALLSTFLLSLCACQDLLENAGILNVLYDTLGYEQLPAVVSAVYRLLRVMCLDNPDVQKSM